jgi:hypothetical protein
MRKLIVAAGSLVIFGAGWCFGQQSSITMNGTSWKTVQRIERVFYVTGFNRGHAAGMQDGFKEAFETIVAVRPASSWTPEEKEKLVEKVRLIEGKSGAHADITMGQLEATVSTFYNDYRNMPVCWDAATEFSISSLKGNAPAEQELSAARKTGAESGCR